jgi:thiol:disulfide interchange protein DsbD
MNAEGKAYRSIGHWVTDYQSKNYGLISQPFYVLMDYDYSSLNKPVGFTPDVQTYHEFLKEGLAKFKSLHPSEAH